MVISAKSTNRRNGDNTNASARVYNVLILLVDIIVLNLKIWFYAIEDLLKLFIPQEETDVRDEVVLITGAAHGMGKEMALQYGSLGAKVVCWDINEKGNNEVVKEIKARGGKAYGFVCNVTKRDEINDVAEKTKKEVGFVSILCNNAGIMPCHSILQHTEAEVRAMFDINVLGNIWMIQAFLPDMIKNSKGHIVALSSCAGLFGLPNLVPYCGTKFAVRGMMQALAEELRSDENSSKIKFTTIYPYMVDTGLCKKPKMRFPSLMKLVKPDKAATAIISAQRKQKDEVSIPGHYIHMERLMKFFPKKSCQAVNDFLDAGVDSDL